VSDDKHNPLIDSLNAAFHYEAARFWSRTARQCAEIANDHKRFGHECAAGAEAGFRKLGIEVAEERFAGEDWEYVPPKADSEGAKAA
jgi:hypothetical protein